MTPERLALVTALMPTFADFTRLGPIVHVPVLAAMTPTGPRYENVTYELKMFLDGFTDLNKEPAPGVHYPEPARHYEIWCEGEIISTGTY